MADTLIEGYTFTANGRGGIIYRVLKSGPKKTLLERVSDGERIEGNTQFILKMLGAK